MKEEYRSALELIRMMATRRFQAWDHESETELAVEATKHLREIMEIAEKALKEPEYDLSLLGEVRLLVTSLNHLSYSPEKQTELLLSFASSLKDKP